MIQKLNYLITCLRKRVVNKGNNCPSCGCKKSDVISRKFIITVLRRCDSCKLMFRVPTTSESENASFYQEKYSQGFTTDCPTDEKLEKYKNEMFSSGEKNYSGFIDLIEVAGGKKGDRLFDFGCSWGYGSWQFMEHGFNVESYEISVPRAEFARKKLGVKVHSKMDDVTEKFDIFFSSHVLEHVPAIKDAIDFGMSVLKPGGLFVALTPNGSLDRYKKNKKNWDKQWGLVHPNFLDDRFYKKAFPEKHMLLASLPYDLQEIEKWRLCEGRKSISSELSGGELLVLVRL